MNHVQYLSTTSSSVFRASLLAPISASTVAGASSKSSSSCALQPGGENVQQSTCKQLVKFPRKRYCTKMPACSPEMHSNPSTPIRQSSLVFMTSK